MREVNVRMDTENMKGSLDNVVDLLSLLSNELVGAEFLVLHREKAPVQLSKYDFNIVNEILNHFITEVSTNNGVFTIDTNNKQ